MMSDPCAMMSCSFFMPWSTRSKSPPCNLWLGNGFRISRWRVLLSALLWLLISLHISVPKRGILFLSLRATVHISARLIWSKVTHSRKDWMTLIFFYLCCTNEIPLPNAEFPLYNCHSLTIPLVPREGGRRHRSSGWPSRMTRSKTRREAEPTPPPQ